MSDDIVRREGGARRPFLVALAKVVRDSGAGQNAVRLAVSDANQAACTPPVGEDEIDAIANGEHAETDDAAYSLEVWNELQKLRARREALRRLDAEERGAIAIPEVVSLRDWLAQPDPPMPWRIEQWQPSDSRVMFAAQFKGGKTTVRDNLIRSLVDGHRWLGEYVVHPPAGSVAIFDTEMSRRQMKQWLRDQQIHHDDRVWPVSLRGRGVAHLDLRDPSVRKQWATRLRDRDVRFLILDCLRPVLDALGLDEQREAGRFLVAFDALLDEAQIPEALVIHHMGHQGERSRGDSRLRDWPDVEWRLVRQDDDPASPRYISAYGRGVDVAECRLDYDPATRRLTIAGGSRRDAKTEAALEAVMELLVGSAAPMSGRAIRKALADSDHADPQVRAALSHGVTLKRLVCTAGPRNAKLFRLAMPQSVASVSVGSSVLGVCQHAASQCVSVSTPLGVTHTDTLTHGPEVPPEHVSQRTVQEGPDERY